MRSKKRTFLMVRMFWSLFLLGASQQEVQRDVPEDDSCSAEERKLNMLGDDGFRYAETNEYHAAYKETDDDCFLFVPAFETEERNLRVQQIATE